MRGVLTWLVPCTISQASEELLAAGEAGTCLPACPPEDPPCSPPCAC